MNLIPRFYELDSGSILIDKINITQIKLNDLRHHLSLVSQDTILFNDTIYNNIAYGNLNKMNFKKVKNAAEAANAIEFIEKLPDGFNHRIGDRGVRLSGGQKQRIAIARAILKNAPILFRHEIPDNSIRPHVKFNRPENSFQIAWKPVNGMLVMWPSWMTHGSSPNQSNEERISISGNVMLGGKIGQSEHLTESQLDNWSNKQTQDIDDSSQFANLNIEPQPGGPGNY